MPTCLYKREVIGEKPHWRKTHDLSLGGRNIIWGQWKMNNCPVNDGWEIKHNDIVSHVTQEAGNPDDYQVLVNVLPSREGVIDLLRLDEICVFTHGQNGSKRPEWSVYMLKLLELCNREGLSQEEKAELTNCFPAPEKPGQEVVTFLYMQGEDKGWKPGKIGQMNGALIYPGAREYFRKHF